MSTCVSGLIITVTFDFDDPGELVYSSSRNKSTVSGSFTIPAGASGTTRMRISMKRDAFPACETFSKGEVKDYTLHIEEPTPQPPVAEFTVSQTNITIGETVQFTDLSSNGPTQWQWYFPGGNPEQSTEQNPLVRYDYAGEFDVTLVVSKEGFEPSETIKSKYIVATENTVESYCTPQAINSSNDYIQNVTIGDVLNSSTAGSGYLPFV
jgi:PKD repeat protein